MPKVKKTMRKTVKKSKPESSRLKILLSLLGISIVIMVIALFTANQRNSLDSQASVRSCTLNCTLQFPKNPAERQKCILACAASLVNQPKTPSNKDAAKQESCMKLCRDNCWNNCQSNYDQDNQRTACENGCESSCASYCARPTNWPKY